MPGIWEVPELSRHANPKYLEPIEADYGLPIVIAHLGSYSTLNPWIWFDEAVDLGRRHGNVWFDISAVLYVLTEEWMVRTTGLPSKEEKTNVPGLNAQGLLDSLGG